jgi:hypothetical protein
MFPSHLDMLQPLQLQLIDPGHAGSSGTLCFAFEPDLGPSSCSRDEDHARLGRVHVTLSQLEAFT